MADYACIHEQDIVAAVLSRQWDSANDALKQHAAECEVCGDVVAVTSLLSSDQERARYEARVPAAGQVWWRAAVRARLEAAHTAARPMTWLHGIAGACAFGLMVAAVSAAWPWLRAAGSWLLALILRDSSGLGDVAALAGTMLQKSLPLAFVAAACIVLAPIALYLVFSDDSSR